MEPAGTATFPSPPRLGFLVRLRPDGEASRVALMGGARRPCSGGSGCINAQGLTTADHVALGPGGLIAVGGNSYSSDMRLSANALQNSPGGVLHVLDSSGRPLVATYLGGGPTRFNNFPIGNSWVTSLAFDSEGMLYVGGTSTGVRPPTTPGALQSTRTPAVGDEPAGYIYRIDPRTAEVAFTTLLGGEQSAVVGLLPRASGLLVAAAVDARFPTTAGEFSRGPDALVEIAADGTSVLRSARLPTGLAGRLVKGAAGRVFMVNYDPDSNRPDKCAFCRIGATRNNISAFDEAEGNGPVLMGIGKPEGGPVKQIVAPGEAVSLFGIGIGPNEPAVSQTTEGRIGTNLRGVSVLFDGFAAPILYADFEQINAMVPFALAGHERTTLTLVHNDRIVLERPLRIVSADPAFLGPCRNPDGSPNTPERPASPQTEISCLITGLGDMRPRPWDGNIAQEGTWPVEPVTVGIGVRDVGVDVPWFGQAPAMPAGIVKMNVRLPEQDYPTAVYHQLSVTAGTRTARTAVYIQH